MQFIHFILDWNSNLIIYKKKHIKKYRKNKLDIINW